MSKTNVFNLAGLLDHEAALSDLIAPTIYRLASSQKQWKQGSRTVDIIFRKAKGAPEQSRQLQIEWDLASMGHGSLFREDLRKLANAKQSDDITALAAVGTAFGIMTVLMPNEHITKVTVKGDRGDFYLNHRRDQMVEISGTLKQDLADRFSQKRKQILLNKTLNKAIVCVSRFMSANSRLERVK